MDKYCSECMNMGSICDNCKTEIDGVTTYLHYNKIGNEDNNIPIDCIDNDMVNHPAHYTNGEIECIDALAAATEGLVGIEAICTANAIKYLWRWKNKNGVQDLDKAIWYINYLKNKLD